MLVSLKQCHSTVRHNNGPVSGSATHWPIKQTSLKKASLSLSLDSCVNEISECPEGNFKIIRNCTTTSPTICKGCAEEHYFHSGYGEHGGCVPCSQPCGVFYLETRKCETAHDRICTPWNPTTMVGKSKYVKDGLSALKMPPRTLFPLLFFTSLY